MRAAISIALALAFAPVAASQRPIAPLPAQPGPAPRSDLRPTEVPVTVEGCVFGSQLRLTGSSSGAHERALNASEFVLEGSKELLRQLARDHAGHQEIVTGIAIIPLQQGGEVVDTRTKQIGGVRVTGGVRQTGGTGTPSAAQPADVPRPVRIKVQSVTHVADRCSGRN